MPELPEVTTTLRGLKKTIIGLEIIDVWTSLAKKNQKNPRLKNTIKDEKFFLNFKKVVVGEKILTAERRCKNILINISGGSTILIHLKMTGHLLFGNYVFDEKLKTWKPVKNKALSDPYNRFIHFVFVLKEKNGDRKYLALSDARKFAKITIFPTDQKDKVLGLKNIGPEPLEENFSFTEFKKRLSLKPCGKIKTVLLDQKIIAGIGNIYSDEMLWMAGINPKSISFKIPDKKLKRLYSSMKDVLIKGILLGGDSTSDYRNLRGEKGNFHEYHKAYRQTGHKCSKSKCCGIIKREMIGGRSAHYCPNHQELFI